MKTFLYTVIAAVGVFCSPATAAPGADTGGAAGEKQVPAEAAVTLKAPLFSPRFSQFPVAVVNDDPITVDDLTGALSSAHEGRTEGSAAGKDYSRALRRLINIRLAVLEARTIGLDELPEVKDLMEAYSKTLLLELVSRQRVKDVQADEEEVERLYREAVKEYKIRSVLFDREDDARKLEDEVKAGRPFDEAAAQAVADGTAQGETEGAYLKANRIQPQIKTTLDGMKIGDVGPRIPAGRRYALFRLEDIRYSDDAGAREQARGEALGRKRVEALIAYNKELSGKYLTFKNKLIDSLDFAGEKPGLQKLLTDKRAIVEVKGDKPVTVAELAEALQKKFYHGAGPAIKDRKINRKKREVLEEVVGRRVLRLEALKQGIDKTEDFTKRVKEYERSVLFGMFLQKVIAPDVKVAPEEQHAYYERHAGDYASPAMMKVQPLVFRERADAEAAIERLRKGAEFRWLKENAEGQVDSAAPGILRFEETAQAVDDLPGGVRKALTGAREGDVRLYASPGRYFYALAVRESIPSRPQPYEAVKDLVARKVFEDKLNEAFESWAEKLKDAYDVSIYLAEAVNHPGK